MTGGRALYIVRDLTDLRRLERDALLMQRALEAETALPIVRDRRDARRPAADLRQLRLRAPDRLFARRGHRPQLPLAAGGMARRPARRRAPCAPHSPRRATCTVLLRNRPSDGTVFTNELHVAPVRDSAGRVTHSSACSSDVTVRHARRRAAGLREALYRSVAAPSPTACWWSISRAASSTAQPGRLRVLFEPSASELPGASPSRARLRGAPRGRPSARADEHPVRAALVERRRVLDRVLCVVRPDGSDIIVRLTAQPLPFGSDDSGRARVVTFRDITAQRAAEAALAEAEARWKFALEGSDTAVWDYDEEQQHMFYSSRWKRMLGHAEDEIRPDAREWIAAHPPRRQAARRCDACSAIAPATSTATATEYRLRHRDGRWRRVQRPRQDRRARRDDGSRCALVGDADRHHAPAPPTSALARQGGAPRRPAAPRASSSRA